MYQRRVLHHGSDPANDPTELSLRAVEGCWFELHRQGGCGAGELLLKDRFPERDAVEIGDWISFEYADGERWYLGRVEERSAESPAGVRLRLEGMGIELNEVYPGGFAADADGVPPHRIGRTDLFSNDPDYVIETFDSASDIVATLDVLLQRYVLPATHIASPPGLIESPPAPTAVESIKFRGEETVRSVVKQLAMASRGAAWGVNASGEFFFVQQPADLLVTLREGRDVTSLEESRDREYLFNRVLFTGDYVYDRRGSSDWIARRAYRFRGNYVQPESRDVHGERRIRLWIPWIRTSEDALTFVREFFRIYAEPTSRYLVETNGRNTLLQPWAGRVRLEDRNGDVLAEGSLETVRVLFDHVPRFRLEIGPEDPRTLWPEPPQDERWELPEVQRAGGEVSLTEETSSVVTSLDSGSSATSAEPDDSDNSTGSDGSSSGATSGISSGDGSSGATSSGGSSSDDNSSGGSSSGNDSSGASTSGSGGGSSDGGSSAASSDDQSSGASGSDHSSDANSSDAGSSDVSSSGAFGSSDSSGLSGSGGGGGTSTWHDSSSNVSSSDSNSDSLSGSGS